MSPASIFLIILGSAAAADIVVFFWTFGLFQVLVGAEFAVVGGWIAIQSTSSRIAYPLIFLGIGLIIARLLP